MAQQPSKPALPTTGLVSLWRRSIQFRVVLSTVLLSSIVVGGIGWLLLQQTRDGLLANRVEECLAEAANETSQARTRLARTPGTDTDLATQQRDLVAPIQERGQISGFAVALVGPGGAEQELTSAVLTYTPGLDVASIPENMIDRFAKPNAPAWAYTEARFTEPDSGQSGPAVVVGSQVKLPADGATYTLYYVFPLETEQRTLSLVTRALTTAAVLVPVLLALVAWAVARQVITPIRMARQTAERLAAGLLRERMEVRGEDDVARLAVSLNQMASNLQQQIRQLEELSRVQQRFVSDVSHELRTPLTTVRMASDVLHDVRADLDPSSARAAELLQTELDRFENLLADLLEISRYDAGAVALEIEDIDLADVVRRVVTPLRPLAAKRGNQLVVDAPAAPCLVQADSRRVERIVRNLITNAIDHAEDSPIEIRVAGDDSATAVSVRDYGVGLAPGQAGMVFNRFWRADPARARSSGGTGLGLAISMEDALLHGGWLQAWGELEAGSLFRLTLPREAGHLLAGSPLPLQPTERRVAR